MQHHFCRRRGIGLRRAATLWPLAGACFGLVTTASAQTENAGLTTTPSVRQENADAPTAPSVPAENAADTRGARRARLKTYAALKRGWHVPPADGPGLTPEGRTLLVLEVLNTEERLELAPVRDDGGWTEDDLAPLRQLYTKADIDGFVQAGGYLGYRAGIREDGTWLFFVSGD